MPRPPLVSFIIATRNRRLVLLNTLGQIRACGLRADEYEVLLVDNASTDGTPDAVARAYPSTVIFALRQNLGAVAKNVALETARGTFIVFLDDDSYPQPGAIRRMIRHFEDDMRLGAAVFRVVLPDGSEECSAYPNVFIGAGTGFRRRAIEQVGGLPDDFFMQAEEYDLSLRLLARGWEIQRFDDLAVTHLKTPGARSSARTMRLDVRNNIILIARHFPKRYAMPCLHDWLQRYRFIAENNNQLPAYLLGVTQGMLKAANFLRRDPVDLATFEKFARIAETRDRLANAKRRLRLRRILLADLGKNIYAYWLAAHQCGLGIAAIADDRMALPTGAPGNTRRYRGVPILSTRDAMALRFDAVVISNLSPVHAAIRRAAWESITRWPVVDLFAPAEAARDDLPIAAVA